MNNTYKILFSNYDTFKISKFSKNSLFKDNKKVLIVLTILFIKFLIISFLIFIFIHLQINTKKKNKVKKVQISEFQTTFKIVNKKNEKKNKLFFNTTFVKNEMHSYSLYNTFKNPHLSLILMNQEAPKTSINQIYNFAKNMTFNNFSEFEIILYNKEKINDIDNINKRHLKALIKSSILKIYVKQNELKDEISEIINLLRGFYTIVINSINLLKSIPFKEIFQYSKNQINKYHYIQILDDKKTYVYKTKILKDLVDNGYEFSFNDDIIENIKRIHITELNYIHISICPNNNFANLVYVAMISILTSKAPNTFICFYLIIPTDFKVKNVNFIQSLDKEYDNFNLSFIRMDERYNKAYTDKRITKEAYFRFSLGELLPNLNKIIYFDADIIVYKDLSSFYNLNFNGKMILGQPTYGNRVSQRKGYYKINTGILLLNLLEMRKIQFETKVIKIVEKKIKLRYHDQTLLNDYFKEYLGIFPIEFHTRPWSNYREMKIFNSITGKVFDNDYYYFAHKYPTIRHFLGRYKPKNLEVNYVEDWWFFARKSKYYNANANKFYNAFSF